MKNQIFASLVAVTVLFSACLPASAQWLTQTVVVSNGWTAAYLFVDPSSQGLIPTTPGVLLSAGNPIDKIWLWKTAPSAAQYLTAPTSPLNAGEPWVSWGLTNAQNTLATLVPNAAYLIHSTSTIPYAWKIQGRPTPPRYTWDLTGLNFIGFPTPSNNPPNFQNFLAPDSAISGVVQIYQYVGGELFVQPANPALVISPYYTPVARGQAYWISSANVNNRYYGPLQITLPNPSGLSYGTTAGQMTFYIANVTPNPLTVTMTLQPSEPAPIGQPNIVSVPPLLVEGARNPATLAYAYTTLSSSDAGAGTSSMSWTLAAAGEAGSQVPVTLGINRYAMTSGAPGALYAGILQFTDSLGFSEVNIPVDATSANNAGLWVGQVSVTNVNYDLKTYATNSAGALAMNAVTNPVVTTKGFVLGLTTNLAVYNGVISNININNYDSTNVVINTYTTNGTQTVTNGFVVSTNFLINYTIVTNTVIETDFADFYFTNGLLVWVPATIAYPPAITLSSNSAVVLVTNGIAPVSGNPTLGITNFTLTSYAISSFLVTNGIFETPVTNLVFTSNSTVTNFDVATATAFNVTSTIQVTGSFSTSNAPAISIYSTTNYQVFNFVATNYYTVSQPLYAATNGNNLIWFNVRSNIFAATNVVNSYFTTNSQVTSNNYAITQGGTNLVSTVPSLIYNQSSATGIQTTNRYTNLTLLTFTNALQMLVTNYLSSPASNYVIASYNTQGDAVPAPYPLRLIVFNDNNGNCSLMQRVYWGLNPNTNIIVSTVEGALDPNQLGTARRITAIHLPWLVTNTPWALGGGPLSQGAVLTSVPIVEEYDSQAANPFLHTYHPDHNNLNGQAPPHELPMGSESYQITRVIRLSLMPDTNDFISLTSANSRLSGRYNETLSLTGLGGFSKNYQTIGSFSLTQISTVSNLTSR